MKNIYVLSFGDATDWGSHPNGCLRVFSNKRAAMKAAKGMAPFDTRYGEGVVELRSYKSGEAIWYGWDRNPLDLENGEELFSWHEKKEED